MPAHEAVQPVPMESDDLGAGAQRQVEGVAEHDLRAQSRELLRVHALHGAIGAHRHEGRSIDRAVRQMQSSAARGAVSMQQFKAQAHARAPGAGKISIASP
jgi:hypothetical protein